MKKIIFAVTIIFLALRLQAQTTWDSTYRPASYALKVGQFRSFPNSPEDIVFLGNSITANTDWMELLQNAHARNRGISGDITFGVLERLDEVTEGKPAKIFVLIGINDISRNIPDSVIIANYQRIITRIKKESPTSRLYFNTILPVNNEFTQNKNHYNKDEHILFVNDALRKLAAKEKITLIDIHPQFLDASKKLDKNYTMDGLHLNAAGYQVWAQILKKMINDPAQPAFDLQGHRGCRGLMPENTIPAMLKAIDLGVTTLEMDTHITADGQVVVSHDPYFNEVITTTPEGKYLTAKEAQTRLLYNMSYDSIKKYDVGLKPRADFPRQQKLAVYKPLLSDLIINAEGYAKIKHRAIRYDIEIKSKPEGDGKKHPPVEEFVDRVIAVIKSAGIEDRTTIQSFDVRALQVMHRKYPGIQTSLLMEASDKRGLDAQLAELGFTPEVYSPNSALVTPELIAACHAKHIQVLPWTVNNLDAMKKLKAMGVDGIISDYPDLFAQL